MKSRKEKMTKSKKSTFSSIWFYVCIVGAIVVFVPLVDFGNTPLAVGLHLAAAALFGSGIHYIVRYSSSARLSKDEKDVEQKK